MLSYTIDCRRQRSKQVQFSPLTLSQHNLRMRHIPVYTYIILSFADVVCTRQVGVGNCMQCNLLIAGFLIRLNPAAVIGCGGWGVWLM
jgi:hypothetical protein